MYLPFLPLNYFSFHSFSSFKLQHSRLGCFITILRNTLLSQGTTEFIHVYVRVLQIGTWILHNWPLLQSCFCG